MNPHPRDALIKFDAGPHKYTCAGDGNYLSVTTWLHSHFPAFDADAIIKKMRLDKPTCKYYGQTPEQIKAGWDRGRDEAAAAGTAMHAAIEAFFLEVGGHPPGPPGGTPPTAPLLEQVEAEGRTQGAEALCGCDVNEVNDDPPPAGGRTQGAEAENGCTVECTAIEVPNTSAPCVRLSAGGGCRGQGAEASDSSFPSHSPNTSAPCVRLSAGGGCRGQEPPNQFKKFIADHPLLRCYRVEWMIFDEDVHLAGSIDFVSENDDGSLTIYDWKRCKEIKKTNGFGGSALTECISHLPDTNYWHYALQLNTYKTILERKYEKTIKAMFLVGLHPDWPTYQVLKVPDLRQEMADLFALRRAQL